MAFPATPPLYKVTCEQNVLVGCPQISIQVRLYVEGVNVRNVLIAVSVAENVLKRCIFSWPSLPALITKIFPAPVSELHAWLMSEVPSCEPDCEPQLIFTTAGLPTDAA